MKQPKLTEAQEQGLRDQVITADQPGPVLRDFRPLPVAGPFLRSSPLPIRRTPRDHHRETPPFGDHLDVTQVCADTTLTTTRDA